MYGFDILCCIAVGQFVLWSTIQILKEAVKGIRLICKVYNEFEKE